MCTVAQLNSCTVVHWAAAFWAPQPPCSFPVIKRGGGGIPRGGKCAPRRVNIPPPWWGGPPPLLLLLLLLLGGEVRCWLWTKYAKTFQLLHILSPAAALGLADLQSDHGIPKNKAHLFILHIYVAYMLRYIWMPQEIF